ncbi:MAG: hypothetical protein EPN70_08130 [Paraburkholderia sp.]|uniref:hypothetical protein n=1 Tax=Paraburkholderia sp. TaxID=1926495 RepID=UPI00121357C4|nr:hypothetical protein [Paraburkholderia sp.]TAM05617.1 MAG: hypothetical protein EPN70_08130 [Paraburkholderia sp.]
MKYIYSGPPSGVTLKDGDNVREIILLPTREADLPEAHEYTRTLLALGYLTPVVADEAASGQQETASDSKAGATNQGE